MNENEQLVEKFYNAFKQSDYATMHDCYHPDIEFSDPLFQLKGPKAKAMWHMLLEKGGDPNSRTFEGIQADDHNGKVHWEAKYVFSKTGRHVHNKVDAEFIFKDGKIIKHYDNFNLYKWTQMAMGPIGLVLGWTSFFQNKVRQGGQQTLNQFIEKYSEYEE
ncbi:nuclear transport factor 2 family protein [Psychrobium sp. nBUS_13]|uniref:nuclear transport factor 2 family protein n=1 Tax=Psychrobium sp. nBUS_13 TaxID=3395319 RepID=UPI003EBEC795